VHSTTVITPLDYQCKFDLLLCVFNMENEHKKELYAFQSTEIFSVTHMWTTLTCML